MDFVTLFEYPLPVLTLDIDSIAIETASGYEGSFTIKNTGGGTLSGTILSNSRAVKFSPEAFSGKSSTIFYSLDLDIYKPGDIIKTEAVIMSNGGEFTIPISVKILPYCLDTPEGITITNLEGFYSYAKEHPVPARHLFTSQDFIMWLIAISYPHMTAYESFAKDPSRERGLDNFFVLNGQKKQAYMQPTKKSINVTTYNNNIVSERITFHKSGKGYLEQKVELKDEAHSPWLRLDRDFLLSSDFDENNTAYLDIYINPGLITEPTAYEEIFTGDYSIKVMVIKSPALSFSLSKTILSNGESGQVIVSNYTGNDIMIEITADDPYLKFEGKRYSISNYAKIPFEIKVPMLAQFGLKKQPYIHTHIWVNSKEYRFYQKRKLTISV